MKKQEQENVAPRPISRSDVAAYFGKPESGFRDRLFVIIFEAETRAGRRFDFSLIAAILLSVVVVMLDSVSGINYRYGGILNALEWFFTVAFTIEYIARLWCVKHPLRYARSFFGIVDLLAILPTYAAFFIPELHALVDLRLLRLLRMFRLLKLTAYVEEYSVLGSAIMASRRKILIFLSVVAIVVILNGTLLYVIEGGPHSPFSSIPTSVYFAITAVTTVGFGDITPQTDLGRAITSVTMLVGWSILAVPTGIITSEMTAQRFAMKRPPNTRTCPVCLTTGLEENARFCRNCGAKLPLFARDQ
ncbi:ion transporter [Nitrosospira multiformis]|uniref:Ion transport protein n=2 Tax=Nitrosospira multiformis (strain ATCC 25196 / NCIMB 11849 / C 71) TaxID=323848 RepID=Q2YCY6_NITMU|nr:ion transporter [Nitrosospira multiformis]ABB73385.1 Ion transport protein [Nitrosospira multiformis ATCC 25196]